MEKNPELRIIIETSLKAKKNGGIKGKEMSRLSLVFGSRFEKAMKNITEKRVKKYIFKPSHKIVWIVVGNQKDYLILSKAIYCSCSDFYFRVLDGKIHLCYHLIAQKIAEIFGLYEIIEVHDELYESLLQEWREIK